MRQFSDLKLCKNRINPVISKKTVQGVQHNTALQIGLTERIHRIMKNQQEYKQGDCHPEKYQSPFILTFYFLKIPLSEEQSVHFVGPIGTTNFERQDENENNRSIRARVLRRAFAEEARCRVTAYESSYGILLRMIHDVLTITS